MFEKDAEELLIKSVEALGLSARGYFKSMRLSRTIADMRHGETVTREDIASAMMFAQRNLVK
jgi:magnesium chelatase family protein